MWNKVIVSLMLVFGFICASDYDARLAERMNKVYQKNNSYKSGDKQQESKKVVNIDNQEPTNRKELKPKVDEVLDIPSTLSNCEIPTYIEKIYKPKGLYGIGIPFSYDRLSKTKLRVIIF